jgi:hypothetical protein
MTDIVAFMTACLDEDELLAHEATPGPWAPEQPLLTDVVSSLLGPVADCAVRTGYRAQSLEDARHIARHNPTRVLADVVGKRAIVEDYATTCRIRDEAAARIQEAHASGRIVHADYDEWGRANREASILDGVVRHLAEAYVDRPGYEELTAP